VRVMIGLAVVAVFGALFVFDTTALLRLAGSCIVGECGVGPLWISIGAGCLALIWMFSLRRPRTKAKAARVRKKPAARRRGEESGRQRSRKH
jgi:hypothetical protein